MIPDRADRVRRGADVVTPSEQVDRLGPARLPEHVAAVLAGRGTLRGVRAPY